MSKFELPRFGHLEVWKASTHTGFDQGSGPGFCPADNPRVMPTP